MALQYSAAILSGRVLLVLIPKTGLPPPWRWFLHTSAFAATWGLDRVMLSGLQEQFSGWKSSQVIILPQERVTGTGQGQLCFVEKLIMPWKQMMKKKIKK